MKLCGDISPEFLNLALEGSHQLPPPSSFPLCSDIPLSQFLFCPILKCYCSLLSPKGDPHSSSFLTLAFPWRVPFLRVHTGAAVTAGWLESCPVSPCLPRRACARRSTRSSLEWVHSTLDLHLSLPKSLPPVSLSVLTEPVPARHRCGLEATAHLCRELPKSVFPWASDR